MIAHRSIEWKAYGALDLCDSFMRWSARFAGDSLKQTTVKAMEQRSFLRVSGLSLLLLVGCGSDPMASTFPDDDASADADNDTGATDDSTSPVFDIPRSDTGTQFDVPPGTDAGTDRGMPTDRVTTTDTGSDTSTTTCPMSCSSNSECGGCRGPSDPPGSTYCCMSGLCLYMSGVCMDTPDVPMTGDGGDPDSSLDGGADGGVDADIDVPEAGLDIPEAGLDLGGGG